MMQSRQEKYRRMVDFLQRYKKIAVAYSGGIDSTLLLRAAVDSRDGKGSGKESVLALHGHSELMAKSATASMRQTMENNFSTTVTLVETGFSPLRRKEFVKNDEKRCYFCKKNLYTMLTTVAKNLGADVLLDGTNSDDLQTDRPGLRAVQELDIVTPLTLCNFSKKEVRTQAAALDVSNAFLPSESCLATRLPQYQKITVEDLQHIDAAETAIKRLGYTTCRLQISKTQIVVKLPQEEYNSLQLHTSHERNTEICQAIAQLTKNMTLFSGKNAEKMPSIKIIG